jgi:hypothetical protein
MAFQPYLNCFPRAQCLRRWKKNHRGIVGADRQGNQTDLELLLVAVYMVYVFIFWIFR